MNLVDITLYRRFVAMNCDIKTEMANGTLESWPNLENSPLDVLEIHPKKIHRFARFALNPNELDFRLSVAKVRHICNEANDNLSHKFPKITLSSNMAKLPIRTFRCRKVGARSVTKQLKPNP